MSLNPAFFRLAAVATLTLASHWALAADDPAPPKGDKLAAARALIADGK